MSDVTLKEQVERIRLGFTDEWDGPMAANLWKRLLAYIDQLEQVDDE